MAEIIIPGGSNDSITSGTGEYTVPLASIVGQLVYIAGSKEAAIANNTGLSTAPARAVIFRKTAATRATLLFSGQVAGYTGLIPGDQLFLGLSGGLVTAVGLPTVVGSVVQKVGVAVASGTILFFPHQIVVL